MTALAQLQDNPVVVVALLLLALMYGAISFITKALPLLSSRVNKRAIKLLEAKKQKKN
ncbi:hypothetical protein [Arthrobacter woluwensis]|uniref:hypothetical protein n=1 Tax=Arthrobacter woluwensis TaxID=156980 RepID=UPI0038223606